MIYAVCQKPGRKARAIPDSKNYILFYSGKSKNQRAHAGVGLLIHGKFENHIDNVEYVDHNIMYVTLKFNSERIHVISVYAPDINKPREEREYFFKSLHETLNQLPKQDKILVMGDLNSRIGNMPIPGIMQRHNKGAINDNGEMLITLCSHNELRIKNTFFQNKEQYKYKFTNSS